MTNVHLLYPFSILFDSSVYPRKLVSNLLLKEEHLYTDLTWRDNQKVQHWPKVILFFLTDV